MADERNERFGEWCIFEAMGHVKLAGFVTEQVIAGQAFLRLDIPDDGTEGGGFTQYYHPNALYRLTPTTETLAREYARGHRPEPVSRYELPALQAPGQRSYGGPDYDGDAFADVRRCRECGCTDDDDGCDGGCYWVAVDLCSACAAVPAPAPEPEEISA